MKYPKREARRELFRYLDDRMAKLWRPAEYIGRTAFADEGPGIFTGIKRWVGNTPADQLNVVFGGNGRGTLVFTISDGDPVRLADALETAALYDCMVASLFTYGLIPLIPDTYLTRQGFETALLLPPDWLTYSRRIAHRPRSLGSPWHIMMIVFLTKKERRLAQKSTQALIDRFDDTGRDFMTVHAPFVMPGWGAKNKQEKRAS